MLQYGARQIVQGFRGKAPPLAGLHDLAWFDSRAKKLPTASLEDLFTGITHLSIRLERPLPRLQGNLTVDELAVVALLCQWLQPQTVFEFGTFNGRTTLNLAANTPPDAKVYTLDLTAPGGTELATEEE